MTTSEKQVPDAEVADISWHVDDDGIGVLRLGRPRRRGAFTLEMVDTWATAVREAAVDDAVRVVVLTGQPGTFCSGVDLDVLRSVGRDGLSYKRMLRDRIHQVAHAVLDLDKPYLAAISGDAVGAGLDMALMCDLRFASSEARLSEGYIKLGLVPGDGGAWLLPRLVGRSRALHLLWTAEQLTASDALRLGVVDEVAAPDELEDTVLTYARALAQRPADAVAMIKRAVDQSATIDLRTSLDLISSHMGLLAASDEHVHALERRSPAT